MTHGSLVTAPPRQSPLARFARLADGMRGPTGCFFTFHRAASARAWPTLPNRGFYLDLDFLDRLLTHLAASGRRVVTVEEGLRLAADPDNRDSFVNFSIDDCYRDAYEDVVPLFRRHGVPITLFVSTGIPDRTMLIWWIGLEDTIQHRDHVIVHGQRLATDTFEKKAAVYLTLQSRWDQLRVEDEYALFCAENAVTPSDIHDRHGISWERLGELARDPLVEIGSHTVSHRRISDLSADEARQELAGSRTRLREKLGVEIDHFAFPYGRRKDCGPRDFQIAREAGYASVATTTKGLFRPGAVPYAYPRITLNGSHRTLLVPELHIAGITAVAARMLGRV